MKTKVLVLVVAAVVVWGLKRHYSDSRADDLWWILSPTARLVGNVTGVHFVPSAGEGYVSHARLFLIDKSCAGINFMAAAFLVLGIRRAALPLACYYAVALGLPLANGAAGTGAAFARHALVVIVGPILLIVFVSTTCEIAGRVYRLVLYCLVSQSECTGPVVGPHPHR